MRETASQIQRFLGLNKGPGIFLQGAVEPTNKSLSMAARLFSIMLAARFADKIRVHVPHEHSGLLRM
jgi:hypothetical protein